MDIKILNSKDLKAVFGAIESRWGADVSFLKEGFAFVEDSHLKLSIISKDVVLVDLHKLRMNSLGNYFCEFKEDDRVRLSIEGSQLVGPHAKKNVVELDEDELNHWMMGEDIKLKTTDRKPYSPTSLPDCSLSPGYVIIKHKNLFAGCGAFREGNILNFVPKARRMSCLPD